MQEVKELYSLYIYIHIFCEVVFEEGLFLHMTLLNINNYQADLFDP